MTVPVYTARFAANNYRLWSLGSSRSTLSGSVLKVGLPQSNNIYT